jgi:XTP/dITP diphosphohydrolase
MTVTVLVASRNAKKLVEMQRILDETLAGAVELVSLSDVPTYDEAPESGLTFEENALLKAREGVKYTGLPTVGDDSGLAVDALHGMPGVFSARWTGRHGDDEANLRLVLAQLSDVDDALLGAAFVCSVAFVLPDGREFTVDGRMPGHLIREPRGSGGFGYDPIFVPEGEERTSAELPAAEKDAISHRGKALRALVPILTEVVAGL